MFGFSPSKKETTTSFVQDDNADLINSLKEFCATITFSPDGVIMDANDLFLNAVGYSLDEIKGQHHRMFCHQQEVDSIEYASF